MNRYAECLKLVLAYEGGFVNHPNDKGGATNLGVTQATLTKHLGRKATIDDVKALTPDKVAPIYEQMYWKPVWAFRLPKGVDLCVFDWAVNAGPNRAIRHLQEALKVRVDGIIGVNTLKAVEAANAKDLVKVLCYLRRDWYNRRVQEAPSQMVFLKGWLARVDHVEKEGFKHYA
jgi:lysozyme family protein